MRTVTQTLLADFHFHQHKQKTQMIASQLHQARTFHWIELLGVDALQMCEDPLDFQSWEFLDSQLSECIHQQVSLLP